MEVASHTPVDLGVAAADAALKNAGLSPAQIGLVINNCCNPSSLIPSEAQQIADRLGISAPAHETYTACPGFALEMDFLSNFSEDGLPDYVLCVAAAALSQRVDYRQRSDSAIWGDGAAACIVSPRRPGKLRVVDSVFTANPARCDAAVVKTFGHFYQDGRAIRDFSVRQTVRLIKGLEAKHGLDWSRDIFIGHQANKTMLHQITNNRKIPETNHWHNVTFNGNQAGAGSMAVLAEHWDQIRPGQKIVVGVIGAGLSWGAVLFEAV